MKRVLYLDASSGVSGDMFVGALLDAGASFEAVRADVEALGVPGFEIRARRVTRHGIAGTKFDVVNPETGRCVDEPEGGGAEGGRSHPRHDHGHGHHGHGQRDHGHGHHGPGSHDHGHDRPEHGHRHGADGHHAHRGLREIRAILQAGALLPKVARDALGVFALLAEAEAKVHGTRPEEVHFHEVGALDTIADVVAAASAFHALGADEAWCSPVHVGSGTVRCAHGVLPVPAPATLELLRGAPVYSDGTRGELCTPTGAALVRYFCTGFGAMPPLVVDAVGYGAGSKDFGIPNLFRATLGTVGGQANPVATACAG